MAVRDTLEFKVDGKTLPMPSKGGFIITLSDADGKGSGRNAGAYTRRNRLRPGLRKIEVSYSFVDQATSKLILDAIEPEFVDVRYFDPQYGLTTKRFYVGDRVIPSYGRMHNGVFKWEKISFSFVEQ